MDGLGYDHFWRSTIQILQAPKIRTVQGCLPCLGCSLLACASSCVVGTSCTAFISLLSEV